MNENKINFLFPFSIPMFEIDECIKFIWIVCKGHQGLLVQLGVGPSLVPSWVYNSPLTQYYNKNFLLVFIHFPR